MENEGQIFAVPQGTTVDISVAGDFTTLQAARDAIRYWLIPESSTVKITLSAGRHVSDRQVILGHPYESRITVSGAPMTQCGSPSAVSIVSNGQGDHDATFTLSAHGLIVDDWVRIRNLTGAGDVEVLCGAWKVIASGPDQFTVKVTARKNSLSGITVNGGEVNKWNAELHFAGPDIKSPYMEHGGDPGAFEVVARGAHLVNLVITSDGQDLDASGIMLRHGGHLRADDVGISGFPKNGVWSLYNSEFEQNRSVVSSCGVQGVVAQFGGMITGSELISSGHVSHAARARSGGKLAIPNAVLSGSYVGLSAEESGFACSAGSKIVGNRTDNIISENWAHCYVQSATIKGAGGQSIRAKEGGRVDAVGASITGGMTPNANVIQNDQSLIVTNWGVVS